MESVYAGRVVLVDDIEHLVDGAHEPAGRAERRWHDGRGVGVAEGRGRGVGLGELQLGQLCGQLDSLRLGQPGQLRRLAHRDALQQEGAGALPVRGEGGGHARM